MQGWTPAAELRPGDAIQQADGTPGRVAAVRVVPRPQVMYNLTVAEAHNLLRG